MAFIQKSAPPSSKEKSAPPVPEKSPPPPTPALAGRLTSLDQFRGYTVAGMFLVNYLGAYDDWVPAVLLHHHNYCSYADTIMPQFLFAVGFAFRLAFGRRAATQGLSTAYFHMIKRLLGLLLVAFTIYTFGHVAQSWDQLKEIGVWGALKEPLKRHWMATLGHIAVTSLWILPVIRSGALVRILYMLFSAGLHVYLSYLFNYHWTNTAPNGIDGGPLGPLTWAVPALLGTLACDAIMGSGGRASGWTLTKLTFWSIVFMAAGYAMSCGTRIYDLTPEQVAEVKKERESQDAEKAKINTQLGALGKQLFNGTAQIQKAQDAVDTLRKQELRAVVDKMKTDDANPLYFGFVVDKAEREYNKQSPSAEMQAALEHLEKVKQEAKLPDIRAKIRELNDQSHSFLDVKLAKDPVVPSKERIDAWKERIAKDWKRYALTAPPFIMPPQDDKRIDPPPYDAHFHWNYWMITQRGGSLSYTTFAGGFSLLVYVLFYIVCDIFGLQVGLFRTFGTNALAGYVLHDMIGGAVKQFVPGDAPWWYGLASFFFYFGLVYLFLRTLEKNRIYLKL